MAAPGEKPMALDTRLARRVASELAGGSDENADSGGLCDSLRAKEEQSVVRRSGLPSAWIASWISGLAQVECLSKGDSLRFHLERDVQMLPKPSLAVSVPWCRV